MAESVLRQFVDGKPRAAGTDRNSDVLDPSTGEVYLAAPAAGPDDVDAAMVAADAAFRDWRRTTPAERQRALLEIAAALEARAAEFADAECRNTGKSRTDTVEHAVPLIVDQLRFFAGAARTLPGLAAADYLPGTTSYVRREPVGVCAQVAPWNYPLMMAVLKSAPAIAAGNTVVLKPAETTPVTSLMFAEMAAEFLPPGVLNVVCGGPATGRLMVEHTIPRMVSITGSVAAGMDVARTAAADVKRLHLELGGKTPAVVCADADLAAAAAGMIEGGYGNAGQDCCAASRVLVADEIHDAFVEALLSAARACHPGPPDDDSATYGPLNSAAQLDRVTGFLDRLPPHARVVAGGERVGGTGFFFAPTVVIGVRQDDEISQDEVFGPVIGVQRVGDEADAVRAANGVSRGLAASVWTRDNARAMRLSAALDTGCVWVNTHFLFASEMPHGGFKHSGYGKDLSLYGLEDYTRVKHVMHNTAAGPA